MSNVKKQKRERGFSAVLRENLNKKVTELLDVRLSDIHPKYRDSARLMIRWMAGEDIISDAVAAGDTEKVKKFATLVTAFPRLPDDELGLRTRWHVLHIAQEVTELRSQEIDRARTGLTPRPAYTNPNPKPKPQPASKRPAPILRRVV